MRKLAFSLQSFKTKKWVLIGNNGDLFANGDGPPYETSGASHFNLDYHQNPDPRLDSYSFYHIESGAYLQLSNEAIVASASADSAQCYFNLAPSRRDPRAFTLTALKTKLAWSLQSNDQVIASTNDAESFIFIPNFNF